VQREKVKLIKIKGCFFNKRTKEGEGVRVREREKKEREKEKKEA